MSAGFRAHSSSQDGGTLSEKTDVKLSCAFFITLPVPEDLSLEERDELTNIRRRKRELLDDIEVGGWAMPSRYRIKPSFVSIYHFFCMLCKWPTYGTSSFLVAFCPVKVFSVLVSLFFQLKGRLCHCFPSEVEVWDRRGHDRDRAADVCWRKVS